MNLTGAKPRIESLRRSQRALDKQIRGRTAELEKLNQSLAVQMARLKRAKDLLKLRVRDLTAELAQVKTALQTQSAERERMAKTLADSEERYRAMAEVVPVLLWQSGPDKLRTYFNASWLQFTGRTLEQELGKGWAEGVHPEDLCRCLDIYHSAFDRRQPFVMEYRLRHRSGHYRWVLDRGAPMYRTAGRFLGYIGGCLDIHDRKVAEQTLHQSREKLRGLAARLQAAREQERAVWAREIHDELSGTLTALKMDLSLLPDRAARDHNLFLEKLGSMAGLIDRTLDRVHSIVTELRPVVLDKLGLVAAIEWQTREFHERSGIACDTRLPEREIELDSDRSTALFRILQEALTNVVRHANATRVVIDLRSEAGSLILSIQDNGKGIDEKSIHAHTSMGLLGMRERALSFGGATEVAAQPGGGTRVSVRIPVK